MTPLDAFLHFLLRLPYRWRLVVVICASIICSVIFVTFLANHNGGIMLIPVILAAWLLSQRGWYICIVSLLAAIVFYNLVIVKDWPLTPAFALVFLIGLFSLLFVGMVIRAMRTAFDRAELGRQKAEQAELQLFKAFQQQRQLAELKDEFILNVNHELRTPLTGVYGYLELLHAKSAELDPEIQNIFLLQALRGCQELQTIVDNIFAASQSTDERTPVQECSLIAEAQEALSQIKERERQTHILNMTIPSTLSVRAHQLSLQQVFYHLFSNAFKYTPPGSTICVEATLHSEAGQQQVQVCVQDNGPGIPGSELRQLFDRFTRLKGDLSGTIRGAGLGLYLSKTLLENMDGRIWVESSGIPGQGSRFYFTLPAHVDDPDAP